MCAWVGIVISALGTLASMAGQYQQQKSQEKAQRAQAEYNAQIAANEAATQQQLAQNEIAKGAAERNRHIRAGMRQMGEMRSQLGASGFEMDSGSNLSLLGESAEEIQYDANIISQNAAMDAWKHQVGATSAVNEQNWANYQKSQIGSNRTGMLLGMGGTLLSGIGSGLTQYNQIKK
jgi:hypothetical protein